MPKAPRLAGNLHFFRAGLFRHLQTGSFFPSQAHLVETMIEPVPADYRGQIFELGAGTGALTVRLAKRCPQARIMACELDPLLAQHTRQNLTRAGINGQVQVRAHSAQRLLTESAQPNGPAPGFIISGLPLGNLRRQAVIELLDAAHRALGPNGMFIQVQHFLWDRKHLRKVFRSVHTKHVLRNFPPVFVYYAQK